MVLSPHNVPPQKTLIIPSWYPTNETETPPFARFVREQARCLTRRFDVTVLTSRFPSLADQLRLQWGPRLIEDCTDGIRHWQIRELSIPTIRPWIPFLSTPNLSLGSHRKFVPPLRRGFAWYVRRHGLPDVIHAHGVLPAGWIAVELGNKFNVPIVLTEHGSRFPMHLATTQQQALVRQTLARADAVIAVNPALRNRMNEFCPNLPGGIDVIGNVIQTDYFTPGTSTDITERPLQFLYLGKLTEEKGLRYLLEAVRILMQSGFKHFELTLAETGDGPCRMALESMVRNLRIGRYVKAFRETRSREEVREQLRACDVFVYPGLVETFGTILGEAMACGKPVLATRCGGPEPLVTAETGVLVSSANAHELAEGMAGFLNHHISFDPVCIRRSIVRRFGEQAILDKTSHLYADAIHFRQSPRRPLTNTKAA